jgi:hypothetical protein
MKNLLTIMVLYLPLNISQAWGLPPCPGSPQTDGFLKNWNNCWGTYISTVDQALGNKQKNAFMPSGSKYEGEWQNNMPNGQGTATWANGGKYVGEFKDDTQNGQGTYTSADGAKFVGEYKDGKMYGQGTYTYADGGKYVGEFKDNKRNGQGTYTYVDGAKYVGEHKDDKFHGQGTGTFADSQVWEGQWENNSCEGCEKYAAGVDIEEVKKERIEKAEKARIEEAEKERIEKAEKERGIAIINKSKEIEKNNKNIRIALDALNYTFYGSKKDRYIIVLDEKNCIFEETASSSIFYLNNVIVDTIKFYNEPTYNEYSEVWENKIKFTFSGDELVFSSGNSEYSEYKGAVSDRAEVERVQKAWGVIYSKACEGASAGEF